MIEGKNQRQKVQLPFSMEQSAYVIRLYENERSETFFKIEIINLYHNTISVVLL